MNKNLLPFSFIVFNQIQYNFSEFYFFIKLRNCHTCDETFNIIQSKYGIYINGVRRLRSIQNYLGEKCLIPCKQN